MMKNFEQSMYDLIVKGSTDLPNDVRNAIQDARESENAGTSSLMALDAITLNNEMSVENVSPLCQDTGMPSFKIYVPVNVNQIEMKAAISRAIIRATEDSKLRPNAVDPITGKNSGNNLGPGLPVVEFHQWEKDYIDVKFMLKGGGSENKSIQYTLPAELPGLGRVGRDLDGIRKCILHAIYQAQGQGCSPGFLAVGVGGDRTGSYKTAKDQLYRLVTDTNSDENLRKVEEYIMEKAQTFGIGTLGFGGETTLLSCKIGAMNRLPASYFVSVLYMCWAFRRLGVTINPENGDIMEWTYDQPRKEPKSDEKVKNAEESKVITLKPPLSEETVRALKVGDVVSIEGMMYTGRDEVHKYLFDKPDNDCPVDLNGQIIYHCGPVMAKDENGNWTVKAAGPTTSIREEPYQGDVMKRYGLRVAMGKGGMGKGTLDALKEWGGVYLNGIGGAAQYYAETIKSVEGVDFLDEFGIPEAIWHLKVDGFKAVVTMDSHGNSLHKDIDETSFEKLKALAEPVFK